MLGAILLRGDEALDIVRDRLSEEDFYKPQNGATFKAMVAVAARGQPIDIVTVEAQLRAQRDFRLIPGGLEYLGHLTTRYATTHNLGAHVQLVASAAMRRRLILAARTAVEDAYSSTDETGVIVDRAEASILAVADRGRSSAVVHTKQLLQPHFRRVMDRAAGKIEEPSIPTGYFLLDHLVSLRAKGLSVLGGRPSMGKTALALGIARAAALPRSSSDERALTPVLIFSLEMSDEELMDRVLAAQGSIPLDKVSGKDTAWTEDDFRRLTVAADAVHRGRLSIDDTGGISPAQIRSRARRWIREERRESGIADELGLIVVDYLQLATAAGRFQSREQEVAAISRELKAIAKELACHVLALSQLNRAVDLRKDHRPQMADLRESGGIEQDADHILFVYRRERYFTDETLAKERADHAGRGTVLVAKQRNGPIGEFDLAWQGDRARYENLDRRS